MYCVPQSLLNEVDLQRVQLVANMTEQALKDGQYAQATELWDQAEGLIEEVHS